MIRLILVLATAFYVLIRLSTRLEDWLFDHGYLVINDISLRGTYEACY